MNKPVTSTWESHHDPTNATTAPAAINTTVAVAGATPTNPSRDGHSSAIAAPAANPANPVTSGVNAANTAVTTRRHPRSRRGDTPSNTATTTVASNNTTTVDPGPHGTYPAKNGGHTGGSDIAALPANPNNPPNSALNGDTPSRHQRPRPIPTSPISVRDTTQYRNH